MSHRSTVAPQTIGAELVEGGVVVRYLDGREVFYHGPPHRVAGSVRTPPGKEVHVLVTDVDGHQGVMTYVNDRNTHDEILEATGVGRVFLDQDDELELFPGVSASTEAYSIRVDADPGIVSGRVFVFAEDEMSEHAYEIVEEHDERNETVDGWDEPGTADESTDEPGTADESTDEPGTAETTATHVSTDDIESRPSRGGEE